MRIRENCTFRAKIAQPAAAIRQPCVAKRHGSGRNRMRFSLAILRLLRSARLLQRSPRHDHHDHGNGSGPIPRLSKRVDILDAETERELAQSWTEGNEAAGVRLIESSLPFVISIAREYRRWGVPLEDLVQQGNLGLLKAASKFDPEKQCRLITYAAYWIRAEIRDYVVRSYRIVRLGTTRTERRAMRAFRRKSVESPMRSLKKAECRSREPNSSGLCWLEVTSLSTRA